MMSRVSLRYSESCHRKRLSRWGWPWFSHSLCLCTQYRGFHSAGGKTMRSIEFGLLDHVPSDRCSSFFGHRGEYWDYVKVLKVPSQKRQEDFSVLNMKYCLSLSGLIFLDEISFTIHVSRKDARETQTSFIDFV